MADSKIPANKPRGVPALPSADPKADDNLDDNGDPWRHPPVAPKDKGPLESFGESISEVLTTPMRDGDGKPKI